MNKLVPIFFAAAILVGCGGGGGSSPSTLSYNGATTPAAITAENAQPLATASAEAASQMVADSQGGSALPFSVVVSNTSISDVKSKIKKIGLMLVKSNQISQLPAGVVMTSDQLNAESQLSIFCGGSISISDSLYNSTTQGSGTVTYSNLCITDFDVNGSSAYVNGSMQISFDDTKGHSEMTFSNLTVTVNGEVVMSMNGRETCDWDPLDELNTIVCTSTSYYSGSDGKTYQIDSNAEVSGDDLTGWNVNATFYHPDYGSVTMVATGVKFACDNGHPSAGTILITGTGGTSVTITFQDCNTYTGSYTLDGGSTTVAITGW